MRRMVRAGMAAAVVAAVLLPTAASAGGGCAHGVTSTTAKGIAVESKQNCFTPTVIWVPLGKTVTWINREPTQHTVTSMGFFFSSQDMSLGDKYSFRFERAGIFPYACIYHPGMVGAVVAGTPVAPKTLTPVSPPGSNQGNFEPGALVASPQAESASKIVPAKVKRPDAATAASLTAIASAVMGSAGFALGRRRRRSKET